MTKAITVNDLLEDLKQAKKKGLGGKVIYCSIDDEGNEYRPIYFGLTTDSDSIEELVEYSNTTLHNTISDIVILG